MVANKMPVTRYRCAVRTPQVQTLMREIIDHLRSTETPPDMVLCLLPGSQEERYNAIKRHLACNTGCRGFGEYFFRACLIITIIHAQKINC